MDLNKELMKYINGIEPVNEEAREEARKHSMGLLKIPMSLGKIDEIALKLSSITGKVINDMQKKCILIFSADNGIVDAGVSQTPAEVNKIITESFSQYATGVGVIARVANADLIVYDIGNRATIEDPAVIKECKIMNGTNDFSKGSAMTYEQAEEAILVGINAVKNAVEKGYTVIGNGEMGIGNTSTSCAIVCALTGADVADAVGMGSGMYNDDDLNRKINAIRKGLEVNDINVNDPVDVIAKVGGLDIAAIVGTYIGCAYYKVPAVIDGYISSVAAYVASKIDKNILDYAIASHHTDEAGYKMIEKDLEEPMFKMNMRLGEGSGCPFTFFAIDCANSMMKNMYTLEKGKVSKSYIEATDQLSF